MSPRLPLTRFSSRFVLLPRADVDTDQIIPARFLKTTVRSGLGQHAFHDWRYGADGRPNAEFPLNRPEALGAQILVAGPNFGCGSSREHAVWALQDAGFRAVISPRFADIFRANALSNGLLPVEVDTRHLTPDTASDLTVDLTTQTLLRGTELVAAFTLPPFSRYCLLNGMDELDFLLTVERDIDAYERTHPPRVSTLTPVPSPYRERGTADRA